MASVVLDTTVLVSALLNPNPGGVSNDLLRFAKEGEFDLLLSDDLLEETAATLNKDHLRDQYGYSEADVVRYCKDLALIGTVLGDVPELRGIVRDPNDDMVVACAGAGNACYIVTRDKDLLSLGAYEGIT